MQLMIQLAFGCKDLAHSQEQTNLGKQVCKQASLSKAVLRILLALLLVAEVVQVVDDLLQAGDPPIGLLSSGCLQVEVLFASLEDDGEALLLHSGVSVLLKPLRLAALAH